MFVSTEIYIEAEDELDWEPSQTFIILWFGGRTVKLSISKLKAREVRDLLTKLLGRSDRKSN
jgi:hypothetical protein